MTPYFRGWSKVDPKKFKSKIPPLLAQEAFQYSFDCKPVAEHTDRTVPLHRRLFRGPNTWPDEQKFPLFRTNIEELTLKYHKLTHELGHLICESLGVDAGQFDRYFDFNDPDLAASLNRNLGMSIIPPEFRDKVRSEFDTLPSEVTRAHIDGPPFIALLINDKPGLQVVAGEGKWINAPVTCRTSAGDYEVPVIPGSVIVNSGGTLMHLSKGRVVATLHRVNPTMVPNGEDRVSMPFFLLPRMDGQLTPFTNSEDGSDNETMTGYHTTRDRGVNAAVNRMATFPQCTRRWWMKEFKELRAVQAGEAQAETHAAYELAAERARRNQAAL